MGGNGTVLEPTVSVDSPVGHAVDPERPANATLSMDLARGSSVGRYVILDHLGAGGMGVVYRAYDPDLHRRVAIKLLHPDSSGGTTGSARMLREAQAMAQLSHPNVITIHDVGSVDDHIYLAMELISGRTLTQWLRDTPRPWSEVVDVFLQAGRGLVAAHEKELVHRDFKPDNAMIDDAGRVRVMDFGLARTTGVRAPAGTALSDGLDGPTVPEPTPLNSELTREGALMGTPAYMAAEQFAGLPADARTDQFSFCVALWEGIHGARPFAGRGLAALGAAITAGKVVEPERLEIPAAIDRALRRGLSPDPDARWPTLQDLLDALAASARPKARRATAPIAVLLAGGVGLGTWIVTARDDRCTGAHAEMEAIWNEGRAEDIAGHFAAVDPRVGPDTWALQRVRVQTYADQWVAAHTETCAATSLRGEQSSAAMQLRMTCLRHAKIGLDAALTVLADPGPQTVPRAHTVVGGLPDLGRCDDAQRLAEAEPPPPELAAQVDAVHRDIARSRSLILAGKYDEAVEVAASTVDEASEAAHRPTVARALLAHAGAQMRTSKLEEAADAARKAQRLALSLGLWPVALESVRLWMYVVGYRQAKTAQALPMVDFALGLAEHVGSIDRSARLHGTIGALHLQDGNFELAAAQYEAELNLLRSAKTPDRYTIGNALSNVAQAEMRMGDLDAALARQREVLALRRDSVGAEHPVVANALNAIAGTLAELGRFPESEARYREALALRTKVLRPRHPDTAAAQQNLATVLLEQGRLEEGEALLREAITASDAELGPGHPRAITARNNLAQTLLRMGRLEEAETMARAVVDGRTRALPAGHVQIGTAHGNLATILRHAGKAAEAEPHHRAALEILDAALEPGHHVVVNNRGNLASTLLELDRADEAVQELRRATRDGAAKHGEAHPQVANARKHLGLALLQLDRRAEAYDELAGAWEALRDSPPEVRADAAFAFAQAAIDRPDERAAALKLGRMARKLYAEAMETPDPDAVAEVDAWLSEHAPANPP